MDRQALGPGHTNVAAGLKALGDLYVNQDRYREAESHLQQALEIDEKALGPDHPDVASILLGLTELYQKQGRHSEAEPLVDRAVSIMDRVRVGPGDRYRGYLLRAELAWQQDRIGEAMGDLREAIRLAEQQRVQAAGSEHERAQAFAQYSTAFERMVAWQTKVGDVSEALSAIERGRARSLLDELLMAGADLEAGLPAIEREQLQKREVKLKRQVTSLEKQAELLVSDTTRPRGELAREHERLQSALADARSRLYEHYRESRNSSAVYRDLLSAGARPPRLSQIQRRLAGENALVLIYLFGQEAGYLVAIDSDEAELMELTVEDTAAGRLGIDAGPLTASRLNAALVNDKGTGVAQQATTLADSAQRLEKLALLWKILIPESRRKALSDGSLKRLIVIPDGPLALVPFETLVVESSDKPRYLLDAGPPICYGPSATVIYNLVERRPAAVSGGREPVLTVGDPEYAIDRSPATAAGGSALEALAAESRYHSLGGPLTRLPYSGWESSWVVDAFGKQGVRAVQLVGATATEANVRNQVPDRRFIHLACHGVVDQSYGNFFGALALACDRTGVETNEDGFLTLPEIYELDLKACELAILSACQTNFGPRQRGEGVWALSRGFLVAGSRRVVASNWLVDDEAAASLISVFCTHVARAEKEGKAVDYAESLQKAKRWVRNQEKWSSPYYWGTFVLVGPN
jgi:CHAT domain-containing protein